MAHHFLKFLLVICLFSSFLFNVSAEITPPNYDFSLATLEPFFPGKTVSDLQKTNKFDVFEDNGNLKILRTKIKKADYILDLYVQTKDDKVVDLFVRLPQHFLHDLLLAELQKRFKKQDKYVVKDGSAHYTWLNREGNNLLYQGSCSITCFPMFIEIVTPDKTVTPLYQKFHDATPKW
jgi:hypothetical protein